MHKMDCNAVMRSLLLFAFNIHLTLAGSHSLQYFYTEVTPGINFPEFTIVGLVDGGQFVYYDNKIGKMIPKTEWMEKNEGADYWDRETQKQQGVQEIFKVNTGILMERFNQSKGVHTVQLMYGCELHDDGTKRGYYQHGYDGEDFISLDLKNNVWTAANDRAKITKHTWDSNVGFTMAKTRYLENTCVKSLQKYVDYGRATLERKVSPKVTLFQKDSSSPVVCHATGFFPRGVMISWKKNGEDLHEDVELRETSPNQDGTFQKRSILTISPEDLDKNEFTCVVQHSGLEKELVIRVGDHSILNQSGGSVGVIVGAVVAVLLLVFIGCVGFFIWRKKSNEKKSDGEPPVGVGISASPCSNGTSNPSISTSTGKPDHLLDDETSSTSSDDSDTSTTPILKKK